MLIAIQHLVSVCKGGGALHQRRTCKLVSWCNTRRKEPSAGWGKMLPARAS